MLTASNWINALSARARAASADQPMPHLLADVRFAKTPLLRYRGITPLLAGIVTAHLSGAAERILPARWKFDYAWRRFANDSEPTESALSVVT